MSHPNSISKVTVIIPVYNEESNVQKVATEILNSLCNEGYQAKVLLVDDGSTDASLAQIINLTKSGSKVSYISFSRNFGKEAAILAGINECGNDFDVLCYMDSDGQHRPEDLVALIKALAQNDVDIVCGARVDRSYQTVTQRWMAKRFYTLFHALTNCRIEEGVGDFNVLRPNVVAALRNMPEEQPFMKGLISWIGFRRLVVPIQISPRSSGEAKSSTKKLFMLAAGAFLSFSSWPLRVWSTIGLSFALISILYLLVVVADRLVNGSDVPGYASTVVLLLGLGGLQLMSIGILGEYIARIYDSSKRRPRYIIRDRG